MQCNSSSHWFRLTVLIVLSTFLVACGTGDGEDIIEDSATDVQSQQLRLVFEDDFGGPNGAPRLASKEALTVDSKWRAVTGYGPEDDGWFNDEWQLYQNSIDNVYTENGNLVIEVQCLAVDNCYDETLTEAENKTNNQRTGTITSARLMTKDRLEVQYGVIKARIKVPGGDGIWPAFWMLGENWPETDWPNVGEIDIMEMLYGSSDRFTSHFTVHWGDENGDPTNTTSTYVADERLTDGFHVYEVDWNKDRIIGKIDGITYFTKTIDPATMEEFRNEFFLLLNVAVGGAGGSPTASTFDDPADPEYEPQQMLIDWVRVYERPPVTSASLTSESDDRLDYIRIIQSQEFNANVVTADANSTAVPALEGTNVLQVDYTDSATGLEGGPDEGYAGIFYAFDAANLANFTNFYFSVDASQFENFDNLTLEFKDISETLVQAKLSDYTPISTSGNWITYSIPLSAFAGVDLKSMLFVGFLDAENDKDYDGYDAFDSDSTFDDAFSGDSTYDNVFAVTTGSGYGVPVGQLAFAGFEEGSFYDDVRDELVYNELVFKAKGLDSNLIRVKFQDPGTNPYVDVTLGTSNSDYTTTDLGDGWYQVVIPIDSSFGDISSTTTTLIFESNTSATNYTFYLTDIGFNTAGTAGSSVPEVVLFSSDPEVLPELVFIPMRNGTIYLDEIRFATEACTPSPIIEFDAASYNPQEPAATISITDLCAANTLAEVKLEVGTDELTVGVDLDAAGQGSTTFNLVSPASFCGTNNELWTVSFEGSILATYTGNYLGLDGNPQTATATDTAVLDPSAPLQDRVGESFYVLSSEGFPLTWLPDSDYVYSDFGSGAIFNTVNDVVTVSAAAGQEALLAFDGFDIGFDEDFKSFNTKVKDLPGNILRLKFSDSEGELPPIDLTTDSRATLLPDGYYSVSIPMTDIPATDHSYIMWGSNTSSATDYSFQVTDTFYDSFPPSAGTDCAAPYDAPATPTENPADVISIFSNAYTDVAVDTYSASFTTVAFSEPVLNGDDIKGYSDLAPPEDSGSNSFVAIETVTSTVDATTMTNFRIDVWSADISSLKIKLVDFGGDGFQGAIADVEGEVTRSLTAGEWTSLDIPMSEFQSAGLSRQEFISQLILTPNGDSGTIFIDNIYFYDTGILPPLVVPFSDGLLTNGDFETGDLTSWDASGAGTSVVTNSDSSDGVFSARVQVGPSQTRLLQQVALAAGVVSDGDIVNIAFDLKGTMTAGAELQTTLAWAGGATGLITPDGSATPQIVTGPADWTRFNFSTAVTGGNLTGGFNAQFNLVCGGDPSCLGDVFIDNVTVTLLNGSVFYDVTDDKWSIAVAAFDQAIGFGSCVDDDGAGCPSVDWSVVRAADPSRGNALNVTYANPAQFAGVVVGQSIDGLDMSSFAGGNVVFDVNMISNPANAPLIMKVDCVTCPVDAGQREQNLGVPSLGWQTFSVPVDDLVNANGGPTAGGLKLGEVTTGLVIYPLFGSTSGVEFQLDNVRWERPGAVFEEVVADPWVNSIAAFDQAIGFASCIDDDGAGCPSVDWTVEAAADPSRGSVVDVTYANPAQFAGMIIGLTAGGLDLTSFAGGNVVFDVNMISNPASVALIMKVDCVTCPTDAGQREQNLGVPSLGWQTFSVPVDDLVNAAGGPTAGGLKLGEVTTGLVIFPPFGSTSGVEFQLDNVRWELP